MEIHFSYEDPDGVFASVAEGRWSPLAAHELVLAAHALALAQKVTRNDVEARHRDRIRILAHQIDTTLSVLNVMRGRAILADEVGLGKTIEAGLILSEWRARGMLPTALVLTPASLVEQWRREMDEKFGLHFPAADERRFEGEERERLLLLSLDAAKGADRGAALLSREWAAVVIDEAHKVRNPQTQAFKFVRQLKSERLLLLTATPLQNRIQDLWSLLALVDPTKAGTITNFTTAFSQGAEGRTLRNRVALQGLLRGAMVRNTRGQVGLDFPERRVFTQPLQPTSEELELYDAASDYVLLSVDTASRSNTLELMQIQRMLASHPEQLRRSLERRYARAPTAALRAVMDAARAVRGSTKEAQLLSLIRETGDEKVVVFTEFAGTMEALVRALGAHGITARGFHGGMSLRAKEEAVAAFADDRQAQVLVSTDAGSEGRNLQFCHHLVNFDLPWNPMKVEQRIGRIHRLGQRYPCLIYNLTLHGTVEELVLQRVFEKLNLFRLAIGEMDAILSECGDEGSFEQRIFDAILDARRRRREPDFVGILGDAARAREMLSRVKQLHADTVDRLDLSALRQAAGDAR